MLFRRIIGLFTSPQQEWIRIRDEKASAQLVLWGYVAVLGLIPPVCAYFGTTQTGWTVGFADPIRLTAASALPISFFYYVAILLTVVLVGKTVQWMAQTYGVSDPEFSACIAVAAYPATPLLLVGVVQLFPILWVNYLIGLPALVYSIYLLYSGIPVVMEIPAERGFLFASAILAVSLVTLVGLLVATVILWGLGVHPEFTF